VKCEVEICSILTDHAHIVDLKEQLEYQGKMYIFFELCVGGDLFQKMASGPIKEHRAQLYFQDIIKGISWMHSKGVAHRDLKPENCLIDEDGNVKLSDFGLSTIVHTNKSGDEKLLKDFCGTHQYASPEILKKLPYRGTVADIWACGVILYSMVSGKLPFSDRDPAVLTEKIIEARVEFPRDFSRPIKDLINRILQPNPEVRITIKNITNHRWFPKPKVSQKASPRTRQRSTSTSHKVKRIVVKNETEMTQPRNPTSPTLGKKITKSQENLTNSDLNVPVKSDEIKVLDPPFANAFEIIGWTGVLDISRILHMAVGPKSIKKH